MPIVPPTRPPYKNVPLSFALVAWQLAKGAPASLNTLGARLFGGMIPPPSVTGRQYIPSDSPFILVFNHYENREIASWWGPFLMTRIIAGCLERPKWNVSGENSHGDPWQVRWLMAREWWYPGGFGRLVKQPLTRLLFRRLAQVYGFIRVPPVLAGDITRGEGVTGVRQALALTRGAHPVLVGLAPEGHTGPGGALKEPPDGVGSFLLLLTHNAIPLLPVGWYQDETGVLRINFGPPVRLIDEGTRDRRARDRAAATQAMVAIGRLLPERLQGAYRKEMGRGVVESGRQGDAETRRG